LHVLRSLDAVLVAVRDQGQEAGTLDGGVELTLVDRSGAGQAGRDDLAVFGDEVAQGVDVLVVDFLDAGDGEAADWVLRFGRLSLLNFLNVAMLGPL
jgi:predicted GTPase